MKKVVLVLISLLLLVPFNVFAKTTYEAETLQEASEAEGIVFNHDGYEESDDKINIYLFRGSGCSHCYEFLNFLNSIVDNYGKYFNVVSFEVWNNKDNAELKTKIMNKFNETENGVPYIIIGQHTYVGYTSTMADEIKSAIEEEYNSNTKFDVMKDSDVLVTKTNYTGLIIFGVSVIGIGVIAFFLKKNI